jgi:hypothetical protein
MASHDVSLSDAFFRAKEFEGIEGQTKKQLSRLKEILEELGMTGRLSMEKAKAIRAKRELAAEIGKLLVVNFLCGCSDKTIRGSCAV